MESRAKTTRWRQENHGPWASRPAHDSTKPRGEGDRETSPRVTVDSDRKRYAVHWARRTWTPSVRGPATAVEATGRWRRCLGQWLVLAAMGVTLAAVMMPQFASAQSRQAVPNRAYFLSLQPHYEGDYRSSLRGFRSAARSGVRSTLGRWIDSICYFTMAGECYYQMGQLDLALEQYDAALKLFLANQDWMLRIRFPATIRPSTRSVRSLITWATPSRPTKLGDFRDTYSSFQGRMDNEQVLQQGGIVSNPRLVPVHVDEIVRCTALALRRRLELLGPACPHTGLSTQLVSILATRPGPINHWSRAWISVQLGLAYANAGQMDEAISELQSSILVAGEYDHPLTATAQLELGKLALRQGKIEAAATLLSDATISAAEFEQADVMEEAFRYGLIAHLASNPQQLYPPLAAALPWAGRKRFHQLYASLLILAAENQAVLRHTTQAQQTLGQARQAIGRRSMLAGQLGSRYHYQLAHVQYQTGNSGAGDVALAAAIGFQGKGSPRLYHIAVTDKFYKSGTITARTANLVYARVLREPTATDWMIQPMQSSALMTIPHLTSLENWFQAAMQHKSWDAAIEIADQIRRHRFLSTLPMGGRLLALRWILEAPEAALPETARLQRQDLLAKYPHYDELSRQAKAFRETLAGLPLDTEDPAVRKQQTRVMGQLDQVSTAQDKLLRVIAVRREPSEFVFPPRHSTKEIQQSLAAGQLALIYHAAPRAIYAFMLSRDDHATWQIAAPSRVYRQVSALLRAMGNIGDNKPVPVELLRDVRWKTTAQSLLAQLIDKRQHGFWNKFQQLVIVPDDRLWQAPFDALQIPTGDKTEALSAKVRIRYLPVAAMIVPDQRGRRPWTNTAVVVGRLFPSDDPQVAADAFDALQAVVPSAAALRVPMAGPTGLFRCVWDGLVVLDDMDGSRFGPLDWSPGRIDQGKPGSTLARWLKLPWGGPERVVLPGFRTAMGSGSKKTDNGDMLLTLCGLMGSGCRTILISRWRTGGQTSFDLVREFLQELPQTRATDAWHRAVQLARSTEIDPEREPRVGPLTAGEPLTADHPFFWSGYLLIDSAGGPPAGQP